MTPPDIFGQLLSVVGVRQALGSIQLIGLDGVHGIFSTRYVDNTRFTRGSMTFKEVHKPDNQIKCYRHMKGPAES
jgi:hypothetical protein